LITYIKPGEIRVHEPGKEPEVYYVSGGILEVQSSTVTVLADTVVRAADIDEAAAIEAKDRAEKALADRKSDVEYAAALVELARATAQLRALKDLRKRLQ
jgi:F-type H+-transporting ATPase subunit epsilon